MATVLASNADILDEIEQFRRRYDIPATAFGRQALGDANLVQNLRDGRELRRSTEARVRAFMAGYRPAPREAIAA